MLLISKNQFDFCDFSIIFIFFIPFGPTMIFIISFLLPSLSVDLSSLSSSLPCWSRLFKYLRYIDGDIDSYKFQSEHYIGVVHKLNYTFLNNI
jgi:hypothetical protein